MGGGVRKYLPNNTDITKHVTFKNKKQHRHEKHVMEDRGVPPWNGQW
jgi:hypothetical protein